MKELHNKLLNVSIFLVGMGRVKYLLNHDDQVDRRWDEELPMPPYDWGSDEDGDSESRLAFLALLIAYKNACPIPLSSDLDVERDDVALRFFYASRGVVGLLKKLMMKAVVIATALGSDVITNDVLRRAYDRAFRKEKEHEKLINPWAPHWDGRRPPPLRDHTVLRRSKKKARRRKNDRRAELTSALTKS